MEPAGRAAATTSSRSIRSFSFAAGITTRASRRSRAPADVEEPFDLLVHAADGLDLAVLIHRPVTAIVWRWDVADCGEQGAQLRDGGAVALDLTVCLLEHEARIQ